MSSLKNLLCSFALSLSLGCGTQAVRQDSQSALNLPDRYGAVTHTSMDNTQRAQGNKYALVVIGSSRGERPPSLTDPIDKNSFFLGGVRAYKHLLELGFPEENVYFLYADGRPDFTEPLEHETIEYIKEHEFNGSYSNLATQANLETIIDQLREKVTGNDTFFMYIGTHGAENILEIEQDGDDLLYTSEMQSLVSRIRPAQGLLLVDACHSGAYVAHLTLPRYVVLSSTQSNTYGWIDRDYDTGANFFENMTDPQSDANVDGKVTVREAFDQTVLEGQHHWNRIKRYLTTRYNWGPYPSSLLVDTSVIPMIYVQIGASDQMYVSETLSFGR